MTNNNHECDDEDGAFVMLDFLGDALDPAMLLPLVPLTPVRSKRKGDTMGRPINGKVPTAKIGYCGFTTGGMVPSGNGNDHVAFALRAIEPRIEDIRRVMAESGLHWELVFFEGETEGYRFADLKPELFSWAERLGLPLNQLVEGNLTVVTNRAESGTDSD
jgi:hypothetical protein